MSAHVGSRLIFFLSVVGNFLLVLSVRQWYFSPFVASRLTPFTPSIKRAPSYIIKLLVETKWFIVAILYLQHADKQKN